MKEKWFKLIIFLFESKHLFEKFRNAVAKSLLLEMCRIAYTSEFFFQKVQSKLFDT